MKSKLEIQTLLEAGDLEGYLSAEGERYAELLSKLDTTRSYSIKQLVAYGFNADDALSLSESFDWGGEPHPPLMVDGRIIR